ncbi:hypothetical protein GCM10027298_06610 [Epidermidibacterium keratini]
MRTATLLAAGLIAALAWYFLSPSGPDQQGAGAPSSPPSASSQTPPSPAPTTSGTPAQSSPAGSAAVANLEVLANTASSVTLGWAPSATAQRYAVLIGQNTVGYAEVTSAVVLWDPGIDQMTISIAAVAADGTLGAASSVAVERPPDPGE